MFHLHFFHFWPLGPLGWVLGVFCLIPYFLPSIVAMMRNHPSAGGVFLVNFFFGWTVLGWILCMVWAVSGAGRTTVYNNYPPYNPTADSQDRVIAQLRQLQQLRDQGALTEEEFNRQKASILR